MLYDADGWRMPASVLIRSSLRRPARALGHVQVGDRALGHLGGEADRLRQRRVGVDREADVLGVGAHLEREHGLGDQLAGVDADDAGAEHAPRLGVEQQLRRALRRGRATARGRTRPTGTSPFSYCDALAPWPRSRSGPSTRPRGRCRRRAGSRARRRRRRGPAITSAATLPSCVALWASIGSPTMSPMAKMCGTLVRIWWSTGMKPRSSTATPAASAPMRGAVRPAADREQHAVEDLRLGRAVALEASRAGRRRRASTAVDLRLQLDRLVALLDPLLQRPDEVLVAARDQRVDAARRR